jgi:4-hydroxybenzoate polyprenyltransferase
VVAVVYFYAKYFPLQKLTGFLRLARPANIVTAFSDIIAGIAIALFGIAAFAGTNTGGWTTLTLEGRGNLLLPSVLLLLATLGLYGGGVVLNDVFDARLDAVERPERPIPSGLIPKGQAALLGYSLLLAGIFSAQMVHWPRVFSTSFLLALSIAIAAVLYDAWGKHQRIFGPINMGICRGLNLLLGMSIFPQMVPAYWYLGLVPVVYIAAITMISRGEVHGGSKIILYGAAALYLGVIGAIAFFAVQNGTLLTTLPFLLLFGWMIYTPLFKAISEPLGPRIGKAVKSGVLALILMNAAWAAAFAAPLVALGMLLLLPLSLWLAKAFAVT